MAAAERRSRGLHARGVSAKQRVALAALLTLLALPLAAQNEIEFKPGITPEQFATFSRLVAQGIYATPVDAARARGLLGFDVGIAATAVPVDPAAAYWRNSVSEDFTVSEHLVASRLVASKGLSVATVSASYMKVPDSDLAVWGGSLDVPIVGGGVLRPTLALRGAYATLRGADDFDLDTYGAELFLSKGFGPVTPYGAVGIARSNAEGRVNAVTVAPIPPLLDEATTNRITVGVKLSLLLKVAVEATQAEERSYAAKVSVGF